MLLLLQQNNLLADVTLVEVPDVVGQSQASGTTELEGVGFVVAVATAYSSTVPAGDIISQSPSAGTEYPEGGTVTITVSLGDRPSDEVFTGGFMVAYEREVARRRREAREREEREEEARQIEEETTRAIAQLLREQEAKDARRSELARLSDLVARYSSRPEVSALAPRVQKAIRTAASRQTTWALFQLEREIERVKEEEEFLAEALRIMVEYG